jgi:tetratricopeptide (TPR) repeat protein/DNA-binding CsgD family transcriptional regulator
MKFRFVFLYLTFFFFFCIENGFSQQAKLKSNKELYDAIEATFQLIFSDPNQALLKLRALEKQTAIRKDTLYASVLNKTGVYYGVTLQPDSALYYFNRSLDFYPKSHKRYAGILSNIAIVYKKMGRYEESIAYLKRSLAIAISQNNTKATASAYGELASTYSSIQSYKLAIQYLLKAIALLEKNNPDDDNAIATEKQKLANLYLKTSNTEFASKLYAEAKEIFKKLNRLDSYYLTLANEGDVELTKNNPKKALELLKEAENGLEPFQNSELNVFVGSLKAKAYQQLKDKPNVMRKYEAIIAYGIASKQILGFYAWVEYGKYLLEEKEYKIFAKMYISYINNPIFQELIEKSSLEIKMNYYELLGNYAAYTKNSDLGFFALQNALQYKDAFNERFKIAEISEIQFKYQDVIQQKENLLLKNELYQEKLKNRILFLGSMLILIVFFVIYRLNKVKKKLDSTIIKNLALEKQFLDKDLKLATEINDLKEATIKQQEQDLIATSIEKLRLRDKLESLNKEIKLGNLPKVKAELKRMQKNESYWTDLIEKFRRLNPKFIESLLEICPTLSKSEVEFCALVKMNLSYKEIAELLKIEHDSVFTKKYRVVKKLNLSNDTDFYFWIQKIK